MKFFLSILSAAILSCVAYASEPFNGVLYDFKGKPIRKAKIYVKNPKYYTKSDKDGKFGLTDVQPDDTLHIVIGKIIHEIPVEGAKGMSIKIEEQRIFKEEDEELVLMGMGYVKKREYLAPRSGVTGEQLAATGESDLLKAMQGLMPGVFYNSNSHLDGGTPSINVRNATSFNSSTAPLWVVDGTESFYAPIGLTVSEVDRVEVLKDGGGYGVRGANGVIIVMLKNSIK